MSDLSVTDSGLAEMVRPAVPVLAGSFFLKVKVKCNFYKKQVINNSASVIFGLVKLFIEKHIKRYKSIGRPRIMVARYSLCKKLSDK